jgi:type II secretory pathway pseudopilin PulG
MIWHASKQKNSGFTIAELLVATSTFSIVILVALAGFLEVGRLFYKGVTTTQTDTTAQQIINDITATIQTASSSNGLQSANGYSYYCISGTRYTFLEGVPVGQPIVYHPDSSNFGLVKNILGGASCATPCDSTISPPASPGGCQNNPSYIPINNGTEMLADNIRIVDGGSCSTDPVTGGFCINQPYPLTAPNLYRLSLVLAYGTDDVLASTGSSATQQFCAVEKLQDVNVTRGLGQ